MRTRYGQVMYGACSFCASPPTEHAAELGAVAVATALDLVGRSE